MPATAVLRQPSRTLVIAAAAVPLTLAALADDVRVRRQLVPCRTGRKPKYISGTRASGRHAESTHRTPLLDGQTLPAAALAAARRDPLTDLLGRPDVLAFTERLLHTARRDAVHVLVLDAIDFKTVNDTFGHAAGDDVIRTMGQRLARWTSGRRAIAARLGGDEFAVTAVLPHTSALGDITALREQLQQPLTHEGRTLCVGMSVGIARAADLPGEDASRLLRGADMAMYKVKTGAETFPYLATREDAYADTVNGRRAGRTGTHLPVA